MINVQKIKILVWPLSNDIMFRHGARSLLSVPVLGVSLDVLLAAISGIRVAVGLTLHVTAQLMAVRRDVTVRTGHDKLIHVCARPARPAGWTSTPGRVAVEQVPKRCCPVAIRWCPIPYGFFFFPSALSPGQTRWRQPL